MAIPPAVLAAFSEQDRGADEHSAHRTLPVAQPERDVLLRLLGQELRNPVHALSLQMNAIRRMASAARFEGMVDRLELAESTLAHYLDRATILLDLALYEPAQFPLHPEDVDLALLAGSVARRAQSQAEFHGVTLDLVLPEAFLCRSDALVIGQLLSNLLAHAMTCGTGKALRLGIDRTTNDTFDLWIEDDGPCAAWEGLEQLRGARNNGARSALCPGASPMQPGESVPVQDAGVWIAERLATVLGGALLVHRSPGRGTRLIARIPFLSTAHLGAHDSGHHPPA